MKVTVDEKLIEYLEDLSCLELTPAEKPKMIEDLNNILALMAKLGELDTADVPARSHTFDNVNILRDDEPQPSTPREKILQNAPLKNDEAFIAPQTVE